MANIVNQYGQVKVGIRTQAVSPALSSLLTSLYATYNGDSAGLASLKTSLYAAYNGESNTNDSFGSNNGTAMGGLTYAAGKIGNAFQFNGTNSYVSLPDNSMNFAGDFSVSCWFYASTNTTNSSGLIGNYNDATATGFGMYLYQNRLYAQLANSGGKFSTTYIDNSVLGAWNHAVMVFKKGTGFYLYMNGVLRNSYTTANNANAGTSPTYSATQKAYIGLLNYSGDWWWMQNGGKIDAANVWQKALTSDEITDLYNSGNGSQYITDSFYKPTTNDALGTNNGTAQGGLTYTPGKIGTAFTFNGTNAYVSLPDNSLNLTGPYSISMWAYFASDPSSLSGFYFMNAYNATSETGFEYRIRFGKPEIGFFTSGGLYTYWYAPNVNITSAGWYNLTLVKPLNQQPQLYLNGVSTLMSKRISNGTVTEVTYTSPVKCSIGNNITLLANYMPNGSKIDALNVWNKELSAADITDLYNSGNAKQYPY